MPLRIQKGLLFIKSVCPPSLHFLSVSLLAGMGGESYLSCHQPGCLHKNIFHNIMLTCPKVCGWSACQNYEDDYLVSAMEDFFCIVFHHWILGALFGSN